MKHILRTVLSSLLLFCAFTMTLAQKTPRTLLWRISGKGLAKPSYLYGTMHLNDNRLFQFGDSVYRCIERTEGLAIEVSPDEMAAYYVNKMFDQMEHVKKLDELLGQKYVDSHKKALAKKFRKPVEDISASDVLKEKNKWMVDYMQKGEMPTFMDAYLYNIARRQGKWLGGIEDIGDQTGLISDVIDQTDLDYLLNSDEASESLGKNSTIEIMIGLYTEGDLDGIDKIFNRKYSEGDRDKLLTHRNVKMARRMDSLSALRSMFFAVGCAHLPGDSGVIELLRKRGFTVQPVFSDKRIPSKDYTFKEVHLPWTSVSDADSTYTVQMPANPASIKLFGVVEMKFLMDIFNMSGFATMAVVRPSRKGAERDSLFATVVRNACHGKNIAPVRTLNKAGVEGKEYISMDDGGNLRIQLFADDKVVYMVMMSALKKDLLRSEDAETFFKSFVVHQRTTHGPVVAQTFTDSVMGVSFAAPVKITYNDKLSNNKDESWKMTAYTGVDPDRGNMVMLISREIKAGFYIREEDGVFEGANTMLSKQYNHVQVDTVEQDHLKFIHYTGRNLKQPSLFLRAITVLKDSRHTTLMVIADTADRNSPAIRDIFQSFRLIPHSSVNWRQYEAPDGVFSSYTPGPIRIHHTLKSGIRYWLAYDTTTSTTYQVIPDTLGKYTWYSSDSVFWQRILQLDTAKQRVLEFRDVMNGDARGKEYITQAAGQRTLYGRTRLLVSGNIIYKLYVSGQLPLLHSPEVNKYFETFRLRQVEPSAVTQSKAVLLLQDLGSKDSATARKAYLALAGAPYKKKDAPLLRAAVFKLYKSFWGAGMDMDVNREIIRKLSALDDSATVDYVRSSYAGLTGERRPLRNAALSLLASQHDVYSYMALGELLKQGPMDEQLGYSVLNALTDSLPLTLAIYPALHGWAADTLQARGIAHVTMALVNKGVMSKDSLVMYSGPFIQSARGLLPGLKANSVDKAYYTYSLLDLLGRCGTPAAIDVLKEYTAVKNKYHLQQTVGLLMDANQPVSTDALKRLAADAETRKSLYDDLKTRKKTALFPKEYLTQPAFALSAVYQAIEERDEDTPDTVIFLSKRTASYKGKTYLFYLYKTCINDEDGRRCQLAIAGGYDPAAPASIQPKKDLSGVYRKGDVDNDSADVLLKAYLKGFDEEEEDD